MIKFFQVAFIVLPALVFAQAKQSEINEQVWKPFIETFTNHNTKEFMALHSKELTRSPREDNVVLNWQQYYDATKKSDDGDLKAKRQRKIDLRFLERIANEERAIETGIYKTSYIMADGSTRDFYGKFLVVLRKENAVWKILVDTDSSEVGTINEQSFLSAKPLESN